MPRGSTLATIGHTSTGFPPAKPLERAKTLKWAPNLWMETITDGAWQACELTQPPLRRQTHAPHLIQVSYFTELFQAAATSIHATTGVDYRSAC